MHPFLLEMRGELNAIVERLHEQIPTNDPIGITTGNWSAPAVSRNDLIDDVQVLDSMIVANPIDNVGEHISALEGHLRRLRFLREETVPYILGNSNDAVSAFIFTIDRTRRFLANLFGEYTSDQATADLRDIKTRLEDLKKSLDGFIPMDQVISDFSRALEISKQIPVGLAELEETKTNIQRARAVADDRLGTLDKILHAANEYLNTMKLIRNESIEIRNTAQQASAAATARSLADSFERRSEMLARSQSLWTMGLFAALCTGVVLGYIQSEALFKIMFDKASGESESYLFLRILMLLLSVGGPVWFAWLATKQIGQKFKLSEDYGFKAAAASAYEGMRYQAERVDAAVPLENRELERHLLASLLTRFNEIPGRLLDGKEPGSPLHEVLDKIRGRSKKEGDISPVDETDN